MPLGGSKGKRTAIHPPFPDDGRETILLRVGSQEECHIRLQGEGIGEN